MPEIKSSALFDIQEILNKMDISAGQKVAELGCGNFGFFVFPLARLVGKQGKVYAVDILKSTLEEIKREINKERLSQVIPIWSDLEVFRAAKIESSSLDAALLVNVLHQSDKKIEILREAVRLLKRGGRLLVVEWSKADSPLGPDVKKRLNISALKEAAPKLSLGLSKEFPAGPFHFGLILTKL